MVNTMTLGMIAMLMATLVFPGHARFDGEEGLDRQYDKSTQHEAILANDDADRGERRSLRRGVLDADHSGGDKGILREGSSRKAREEARYESACMLYLMCLSFSMLPKYYLRRSVTLAIEVPCCSSLRLTPKQIA